MLERLGDEFQRGGDVQGVTAVVTLNEEFEVFITTEQYEVEPPKLSKTHLDPVNAEV